MYLVVCHNYSQTSLAWLHLISSIPPASGPKGCIPDEKLMQAEHYGPVLLKCAHCVVFAVLSKRAEKRGWIPQVVWLPLITRSAWRPQIVIMLGGLPCPEHAQPLSDRARAAGVRGSSERWPSGPWMAGGGGLVSSLTAFVVANNWDLI